MGAALRLLVTQSGHGIIPLHHVEARVDICRRLKPTRYPIDVRVSTGYNLG